jgi:hypothetical protein
MCACVCVCVRVRVRACMRLCTPTKSSTLLAGHDIEAVGIAFCTRFYKMALVARNSHNVFLFSTKCQLVNPTAF